LSDRNCGQDQRVSLDAVDAISAMVAPVVLLTTGGLISNGLLLVYSAVNDRMRMMTRERLEIRAGPTGELLSEIPAVNQERLAEIDTQLPMMLRRHHLLRDAILLVYAAIGVLGASTIFIAVAVVLHSEDFGRAALGLVLAGTVVMLTGLVAAGMSLARSADAITYAVERTRRLGLAPGLAPVLGRPGRCRPLLGWARGLSATLAHGCRPRSASARAWRRERRLVDVLHDSH
jgi:hypothetical protein